MVHHGHPNPHLTLPLLCLLVVGSCKGSLAQVVAALDGS